MNTLSMISLMNQHIIKTQNFCPEPLSSCRPESFPGLEQSAPRRPQTAQAQSQSVCFKKVSVSGAESVLLESARLCTVGALNRTFTSTLWALLGQ